MPTIHHPGQADQPRGGDKRAEVGKDESTITVYVSTQTLHLNGPNPRSYLISTAERGVGCVNASMQTPIGRHRIRLKIGAGLPLRAIFTGRRYTGRVLTHEDEIKWPTKDWILTRILWLEGMEPGVNRGGTVDSLRRYIYIHGTSKENLLGKPSSHGCIRMANRDVAELFDLVSQSTRVDIHED